MLFALHKDLWAHCHDTRDVANLHGSLNVNSAHEPVLCDAQRYLHKGCCYDLFGHLPPIGLNLFIQTHLRQQHIYEHISQTVEVLSCYCSKKAKGRKLQDIP